MQRKNGNLLVILSDEHQSRAMQCAGHGFVRTPNLDALAGRGMRFTDAYTPSPICVPARAAFATGRYIHETGHWDNAMPYTGTPRSWGHCLQEAGIGCESIGKLHYRHAEDDVGFDAEHIPMMVKDGVGMVWASIRHEHLRKKPGARMLGEYIGPGTSPYTDYDTEVTNRTIAWLKEAAARQTGGSDTGWCLFVGLVAPHFPLVVHDEFYNLYADHDFSRIKGDPKGGYTRHPWVEKQNALMDSESGFSDEEERRRAFIAYYGLVSWLDHNIGRILACLAETGLAGNTNIIYSSDHGDNVGARGLWGKSNLYEESAAVPLILAGPDIPRGQCTTPVSLLDVSATIPALFGLDVPAGMRGESLLKICADENGGISARPVFSEYHAAGAVTGAFMLRQGQYKLIHYVDFAPEIFDLAKDPEEMQNIAEDAGIAAVRDRLYESLYATCDPDEVEARAHADQAALVESHGGLEAALNLGAKGATPPPEIA